MGTRHNARIRLLFGVFGIVGLIWGAHILCPMGASGEIISAARESALTIPVLVPTIPALADRSRKIVEDIVSSFGQGLSAEVDEGPAGDEKRARALNGIFDQMYDQRAFFDKERVYSGVLEELLREPQNAVIARRALLSPEFLRKHFGDQQAVARVYSIKLLEKQAETDPSELFGTVGELFRSLMSNGELIKGQYQDLRDLVSAALRTSWSLEEVAEQPQAIVEELFYRSSVGGPAGPVPDALTKAIVGAFLQTALESLSDDSVSGITRKVRQSLGG